MIDTFPCLSLSAVFVVRAAADPGNTPQPRGHANSKASRFLWSGPVLRAEIEVTPRNVATRQRVRKGADNDDDVGLMSSNVEVCMERIRAAPVPCANAASHAAADQQQSKQALHSYGGSRLSRRFRNGKTG